MAHTFTVTRVMDDPNADSDDPEYTTGGTHDETCSVWYPCVYVDCEADDEGEFHGIEHRMIGAIDGLCVPSTECGLRFTFEYDNPEFQMTELGIYDIQVEWDGDYWLAHLTRRPESGVSE